MPKDWASIIVAKINLKSALHEDIRHFYTEQQMTVRKAQIGEGHNC